MLLVPVFTGSPDAMPMAMRGITPVPAMDWNTLIWSKLPPKLSWCEPLTHDMVSLKFFTGALRRCGREVVVPAAGELGPEAAKAGWFRRPGLTRPGLTASKNNTVP